MNKREPTYAHTWHYGAAICYNTMLFFLQLSMRMDGCIKNFMTQRSGESEDLEINTTYKRVSSCDDL